MFCIDMCYFFAAAGAVFIEMFYAAMYSYAAMCYYDVIKIIKYNDSLWEASVMKKYIIVLIAMGILLLCFCIYGWIKQAAEKKQESIKQKERIAGGETVFARCGGETESFAESFDENIVYSLKYERNRETTISYNIENKKLIAQVFDALSKIRIEGETNQRAEDFRDVFTFSLPMGKSCTFTFEEGNLIIEDKAYTVTDTGELWALATQIAVDNCKDL